MLRSGDAARAVKQWRHAIQQQSAARHAGKQGLKTQPDKHHLNNRCPPPAVTALTVCGVALSGLQVVAGHAVLRAAASVCAEEGEGAPAHIVSIPNLDS